MFYRRLRGMLPEPWVYQVALLPFLGFYALFAAVLYPNAATLHPTHLMDSIRSALPAGKVEFGISCALFGMGSFG
jgi:ATP:ADP antiporter, AAA family